MLENAVGCRRFRSEPDLPQAAWVEMPLPSGAIPRYCRRHGL